MDSRMDRIAQATANKNCRIIIKTEASEQIGLGHLKRMTALGQYLRQIKKHDVVYAINKNAITRNLMKDKGYSYHRDFAFAESAQELTSLITKLAVDTLVIDVQKLEGNSGYHFANIKRQTGIKRIILFGHYVEDDFVDAMIFPGIVSDEFETQVKGNKKVLYGPEFIFIDPEFKKITWQPHNEIVLCFGGTDLHNLTTKMILLLNQIKIEKQYVYKIITGPYFRFLPELHRALTDFKHEYRIIPSPASMAEELRTCCLGITYYGVTFYEFKFLGIPTIDILSDAKYENEFKKLTSIGLGNYCGTKDDLIKDKIESCLNHFPDKTNRKFAVGNWEQAYTKVSEVL